MTALLLTAFTALACALPGSDAYDAARRADRAGQYAQARAAFDTVAQGGGPLAPYARLRAARCVAREGDATAAETQYREMLAASAEGPWSAMAHAELGLLLYQQKRYAEAQDHLAFAVDLPFTPWWMRELRWASARNGTHLAPADPDRYAFFRQTLLDTFYRQERLDAATILRESPSLDDRFLSVAGMLRSGAPRDAARLLAGLGASPVDDASLSAQIALLGRLVNGSAQLNGDEPSPDRAWLRLALTQTVVHLAAQGQFDEARAVAAFLTRCCADTRETGDALWYLAGELVDAARPREAAAAYAQLAEACPTHRKVDDALLEAGLLWRDAGEDEKASEAWTRLTTLRPGDYYTPAAWYWMGRLSEKKDQRARALECYRGGARGPLGNFYVHRCSDRLLQVEGGTPPKAETLRVAGDQVFVRPIAVPGAGADEPPAAIDALREDEHGQRLRYFGARGMEEGEWETYYLVRNPPSGPWKEEGYRLIAECGYAYSALEWAQAQGWEQSEQGPGPKRLQLEFPRVHWELVQQLGRELYLDPYLILAVGRQESSFRPALSSSAGASGLMQVMPDTAKWLAKSDSRVDAGLVSNLEDPASSLRLGSVYLSRMMERWDDNIVLALSSYNAGPGRAIDWAKARNTNDLDVFVEGIPFSETRDYVKRVLGNLAAYHSLYAAAGSTQ